MPHKLKIALIGLGNIGKVHVEYLKKMNEIELVGVCDMVAEQAEHYAREAGCAAYTDYKELFAHSGLQAVIIAVPHYDHAQIAIDAFAQGIHVLCEKPISVLTGEAERMLSAYEQARAGQPELQFAMMFQERLYPHYKKLRELLKSGLLGKLTRVTWINTTMFRTQAYYDSGGWRATWAGEGGGILVNQCPHTLDMYQWLFGLPTKISAHAHIGKYHHIEVEDEVTAYFEHESGMIGHLIVSTAESPGTNRMEIVGEHGRLVYEHNTLTFYQNRQSMLQFIEQSTASFGRVENWVTEIPIPSKSPQGHHVVAEHFVRSILQGNDQLIARGEEGLNSVIIANGIMLSSFEQKPVAVPFDSALYAAKLEQLIAESKFVKQVNETATADMSASYAK